MRLDKARAKASLFLFKKYEIILLEPGGRTQSQCNQYIVGKDGGAEYVKDYRLTPVGAKWGIGPT
jgi:hypothetical protein